MICLITGGAGFIGSALIRHIINSTQDIVINVDKLTYAGNLESLSSVSDSDRYHFEQVDICDRSGLNRVFTRYRPDVVMHLAAESHVDRSIDGPAAFVETNIIGTYILLEAARQYWQSLDEERKSSFRVHHISTDEVYGDLAGTKELFTEKSSYAPNSPYSASKASSDHLVRAWFRTYGLPIVITNCSNNYGPYQFPEKLIPLMIINALEGKPLPVYGDGQQIRDWLYVEDHTRALYLVATKGTIGETYNIGGHNQKANIEVARAICDLLEELVPTTSSHSASHHSSAPRHSCESRNLEIENVKGYKNLITFVEDRPGHDKRYAIDASKIEHELGWKPRENFDSGIRKTVEWYLNNKSWWSRVLGGSYSRERLGVKG